MTFVPLTPVTVTSSASNTPFVTVLFPSAPDVPTTATEFVETLLKYWCDELYVYAFVLPLMFTNATLILVSLDRLIAAVPAA
jgi:hypothetical protein